MALRHYYHLTTKGYHFTPDNIPLCRHLHQQQNSIVGKGFYFKAIQIVKQWRTTERRAVQAESEKANAELSFLRAQINPHFLFNTLNNIYSLILTKNDAAPEAVLKLPHIMRYVTDEPWRSGCRWNGKYNVSAAILNCLLEIAI